MSALGDLLRARASAPVVRVVETNEDTWLSRGGEVGWSPDLERVLALPRRPQVHPQELVEKWTAKLRRPGGTMVLYPAQAFALEELELYGRLFAAIGAGGGKTLVGLLTPVVIGSRTAAYFTKSGLLKQIRERQYPELVKHWLLPSLVDFYSPGTECVLHLASYESLSSPKTGGELLERINPDLLVADEAHTFSQPSTRTRRFRAGFRKRPSTRFVPMTATPYSRSIKDAAPLCKLSLREGSPLPLSQPVLEEWAAAVDEPRGDAIPAPRGALEALGDGPMPQVFGRRFVETPGVVVSLDQRLPTALNLYSRQLRVPKIVKDALLELRGSWVTPDGDELTDNLAFSRYARQMACGFYYRRTWPRGEPKALQKEWLTARSEWSREVRAYLQGRTAPGLDSESLLEAAAQDGRWRSNTYARWADVRDQCEPGTEAVWLDPFLAEDAAAWGGGEPGVIWTDWTELGRRISKLGGFEYFGGKEDEARFGAFVLARQARTVVLSVDARGTGTDGLQWFMSRQLFTRNTSNGKNWEQYLARLHRKHQTAPEVETYLYRHTPEATRALDDAVKNARQLEELLKSPQRLNYGTRLFECAL